MTVWLLLVMASGGTVTKIHDFKNELECKQSGHEVAKEFNKTNTHVNWVCLKVANK